MTNKEILKADLLDILFENRNKAYGAYALRRNYNHRMLCAFGISVPLVLFLLLMISSEQEIIKSPFTTKEVVVSTESLQWKETKEIRQVKQKAHSRVAAVMYTSQVKFVDNSIKPDVPDQKELDKALISGKTVQGDAPGKVEQGESNADRNGGEEGNNRKGGTFNPTSSEAQFPGGNEAFGKFLRRYLVTPDDLEAGENKIVLVRFMVDVDGSISKAEIVQSDGDKYSREVLRVLGKMPKWLPATQNGIKMATWFIQPVTFIGIEQ